MLSFIQTKEEAAPAEAVITSSEQQRLPKDIEPENNNVPKIICADQKTDNRA